MLNQSVAMVGDRIDPTQLLRDFEHAVKQSVLFTPRFDRVADGGEMFRPDELEGLDWDEGWQAVYVFALEPGAETCVDPGRVLKVGLASSPNRVRAHLNPKIKSSLSSSIAGNHLLWDYLGVPPLTADYGAEDWIRDSCYVLVCLLQDVEFKPRYGQQGYEGWRDSGVVQMERYLRARLGPVFEGTGSVGVSGYTALALAGVLTEAELIAALDREIEGNEPEYDPEAPI